MPENKGSCATTYKRPTKNILKFGLKFVKWLYQLMCLWSETGWELSFRGTYIPGETIFLVSFDVTSDEFIHTDVCMHCSRDCSHSTGRGFTGRQRQLKRKCYLANIFNLQCMCPLITHG